MISQDQKRAKPCRMRPLFPNSDTGMETMPRTTVYTQISGSKMKIRAQAAGPAVASGDGCRRGLGRSSAAGLGRLRRAVHLDRCLHGWHCLLDARPEQPHRLSYNVYRSGNNHHSIRPGRAFAPVRWRPPHPRLLQSRAEVRAAASRISSGRGRPGIVGAGRDHPLRQRKQNFRHLSDGLVAHRAKNKRQRTVLDSQPKEWTAAPRLPPDCAPHRTHIRARRRWPASPGTAPANGFPECPARSRQPSPEIPAGPVPPPPQSPSATFRN